MSFVQNLDAYGSSIALLENNGRSISYQDLAKEADRLSEKIGKKKRFFVVKCSNNIDTIIGYLAALRGGHAVLMMDSSLDISLLNKLIIHYQPDGIWEEANGRCYEYTSLESNASPLHPDLALLLSTSGSTGSPKLVKLTTQNLQSNAESIVEYLQLNSTELPITTLPLHYSYGLSIINSHLLVGAKVLLTSQSVVSKEFWDFFKEEKATSFAGVPYTYEMLQRLKIERMELPSLRYMTQAGGKMAPHMVECFAKIAKEKGCRFYTMYGQTEATARISWLPPDKVLLKKGSIGIAIPKGEITLESATGELIDSPDTEGELVYRGNNVMMGYAESAADLALDDQLKGVLRTGDIAKYDSDGFYYITGRLKRFVKIFGNRVNLEEIEQDLSVTGFTCKCVGEDNLLIIATLNDDGEQIKQLVIDKYKFHHSVIKLLKVEEFPLGASGKVLYSELLSQYQNELKV